LADRTYTRKAGGGRKPEAPRLVFEGIVYALRTGYQRKVLPAERFDSAADQGDFSPRRCSYRVVSFMMSAASLKNRILSHCRKIHSRIDEEPKKLT